LFRADDVGLPLSTRDQLTKKQSALKSCLSRFIHSLSLEIDSVAPAQRLQQLLLLVGGEKTRASRVEVLKPKVARDHCTEAKEL
jgi:hypothetical protein